jgi:glutamyl-tRNA synthetase
VEYCEIYKEKINPEKEVKIKLSLPFLKNKAKTLEDIYNNAKYIISDEIIYKNDDLKLIDKKAKKIIKDFKDNLSNIENLNRENLEPVVNILIKNYETNFKGVGQPLRVALTGSKFGPGLYDIVISLGKEEVIKRLESKILIQN